MMEAKHVGAHLMDHLKQKCYYNLKAEKNKLNHSGCLVNQILFHCFVCYPTLSLLCMFQSYNDSLVCG